MAKQTKKQPPQKTTKAPAKKAGVKKTTTKKKASGELEGADNVNVTENGNQFIVSETSEDGGVYRSYISDTNPLEEEN